jgi:Calcineurin-like phosphoesterase
MSSGDAGREKVTSRRRFIKWAGTLAVAGLVGMQLEAAVGGLIGSAHKAAGPAGVDTTVTATEVSIATDYETMTELATVTSTETETTTAYDPQTNADAAVASRPQAALPAEGSFSIFWITDTQFLAESNPALYKLMCNWIVSNWAEYNGKLVMHTGDMVQNGDVQQEWGNASDAHLVFLQNRIPYTWCAGNHDDYRRDDPNSGWAGNIWAPAFDPVQVEPYINSFGYTKWVGSYRSGMNTALTFGANGLDFLVISIEWNAPPEALRWAEGILDDPAYAGYNAIVAPHAYIDAFGLDDDGRWGAVMADFVNGLVPILDSHPNVFLTLNGHFATDSGYNTPTPVNGRNELMFDRQDCTDNPGDPVGRGVDPSASTTGDGDKAGGATVTILNFDTEQNLIHVSTYDAYTQQWRIDRANQYTVKMFPRSPSGT